MSLLKMVAGAAVVFSLGGAYTYVNAQSGDPQMAKKSLNFGFQQTADVAGEIAKVPANVVVQVKPGLTSLAQQGGTVLGTESTPAARTDLDTTSPDDQTTGGQQ